MIKANHSFRAGAVALALGLCVVTPSLAQESASAGRSGQHPLEPALQIAREAREKVRQIGDYQAELVKKEVIGRRAVTHKMRIKIRHEPFSVYLHFLEPNAGREVLYIEGQNEGQLLAHDTGLKGLVGTVKLSPTSAMAMEDSRYPITRIGLEKLLDAVIEQWEQEMKFGETDVKFYKDAKIGDVECRVVESTHPQPRKQFTFKTTRLWIDKRTGLPIRVEQFGFPKTAKAKPPLVEQYTYLNIRTNAGLTDADFDKDNPRYKF